MQTHPVAADRPQHAMTLLAQLTDLHIREPGQLAYGRVDTAEGLVQAITSIRRLPQRPDALVITGDLTDFGREPEYAHLARLLEPLGEMPIHLLPGNHDERDQLRRSFPRHGYLGSGEFIQYSVPVGSLQLIALDTVTPRSPMGNLCSERLDWLEAELSNQGERPVVIAMHHPPFQTLIGGMDHYGLQTGARELEAIVARHPNVERIICGHMHRSIQVRFGGTIASTIPSPAHQINLDLSPDAPLMWTLEPPAYALHALPDGGRMVTHMAACGAFDGPHPFR